MLIFSKIYCINSEEETAVESNVIQSNVDSHVKRKLQLNNIPLFYFLFKNNTYTATTNKISIYIERNRSNLFFVYYPHFNNSIQQQAQQQPQQHHTSEESATMEQRALARGGLLLLFLFTCVSHIYPFIRNSSWYRASHGALYCMPPLASVSGKRYRWFHSFHFVRSFVWRSSLL